MDIYFTEYDKNIAGESMRDPLGLQPIWAYFGSRVIKNITTVSNDIRGFRETLLCLSIARDCVGSYGGMLKEYVLLFEQLFIYTMIENKQPEGIIGSDNGRARLSISDNPVITWKSDQPPGTILASQISLGYYGRYKTPLINMGIIDDHSCIRPLSVDIEGLYGNDYLIAKESFISFLKKRNHRFMDFDRKGRNALINCVCGSFRPCEKKFWFRVINSNNLRDHESDPLMEVCRNIIEDYYEWPGPEIFYKDLYKESGSIDVENILKIEPFLTCVEYVFYNLLNSRSLDDVKLPKERLFKDCYVEAKTVEAEGSDVLRNRFSKLIAECGTYDKLAQGILNYHRFVCKQKQSSVWADVSKDRIIHTFVHDDCLDDYTTWNRDYYAVAYRNIVNGIEAIDR